MDYLAYVGASAIRVVSGRLAISERGLEGNGTQSIQPIVTIQAVTIAAKGLSPVDLLRSFILIAGANGEVTSAWLSLEDNDAWVTVFPHLQRVATSWGRELAESHRKTGNHCLDQPPMVGHDGSSVSAGVAVGVPASEMNVTFISTPLAL
ncbi:hypothetical protein [Microbacterium sp. MTN4-26]|uniref:hypothetical protein n=1 Tax=unclassified Microbacterium TaxID=2609290 RepID=UPI0036F1D178